MAISKKGQILIENMVVTLLITLIGFLVITQPYLKYIISILWAVPIVFLIGKNGFYSGISAILASSLLILTTGVGWEYLVFLFQFVPIILLIAIIYKNEISIGKGLLLVFTASFLINSTLMFITLNKTETELFVLENKMQNATIKVFNQQEQDILDYYDRLGANREDVQKILSYEKNIIPKMVFLLPGFLTLNYMLSSTIIYYITKRQFKIKKTTFPAFATWHIPWYFIWLIILGTIITILGDYYHITAMTLIGINLFLVITPFLLTIGISVIFFFLRRWKISIIGKLLFFFLFIISPQPILLFVLFLGIFDPCFDFRRLYSNKGSVSGG